MPNAQMPNAQMPRPKAKGQMPNAKCQMPNAKCTNAKCQMPNAKCQMHKCQIGSLAEECPTKVYAVYANVGHAVFISINSETGGHDSTIKQHITVMSTKLHLKSIK